MLLNNLIAIWSKGRCFSIQTYYKMVSRSFLWGVVAASLTWSIILYLYWSLSALPKNTSSSSPFSPFEQWRASSSNNLNVIHNNFVSNEDNGKGYMDKSISLFKQKYNRFQKEKKDRKISQKLMNELMPIVPNGTDEFGMVKNSEEQFVRDVGYRKHAFNVLVSNKIGLFRNIPDTRHKLCHDQSYDKVLPLASIIMCFYNEHLMTLIRSVNTILERTPQYLLKEIILVDDYSEIDDLKNDLENMIKTLKTTKVKLLRNDKREGLMRSRVYGARNATGDVLIFLDSHIEVNKNWVEPLLSRIKANKTVLAMPVIDIINSDTFTYSSSPLVRGGFNWGLHFKWENLPGGILKNDIDFIGPFHSPTMAGGLFAVDRKYFTDMGEYDMGMDIWGGENLEISFRVWQCGGSIELVPCSRIGHVFRKRRPYGSPNGIDTMIRNSLRLANVWMDDYKDYFMQQQPSAKYVDFGDITERENLRQKLSCKPFAWYLKTIYPELDIPGEAKSNKSLAFPQFEPWHSRKRNYISNFMIRLTNTTLCITTTSAKEKSLWRKGSSLVLMPCMRVKNQMWYETERSELVLGQLLCLEAPNSSTSAGPVINKCHEMGGDQEWKHRKTTGTPIYNLAAGTCLSAKENIKGAPIHLSICSNSPLGTWDLVIS